MRSINAALEQRIIPATSRSGTVRDCIVFQVPLPPPANSLFANVAGKGRVKSRRYRAWIKEAGWLVRSQRVGTIEGAVQIRVEISNSAKSDTDSFFKSILDLAVRNGLIEDDNSKIVRGLTLDFADIEGARVTIRRAV
jgi:Holliday junction resolvase RusA-like endonuclease